VGCLVLALVLLGAVGLGAYSWLSRSSLPAVLNPERCVARVGDLSVELDLEQAHFAAIITGLSVRRELPPRAASIALATAYQESGIRNIRYGDRDSLGLFQQRPSQGWGTKKQILDPHYATGKFYDALVKIKGWKSGDINDVAQKVQRSGYPEAYRDHVGDARVLASALSGQTAAAFSCYERQQAPGDPDAMLESLTRTFGNLSTEEGPRQVTIATKNTDRAWAYAQHAVANAALHGVTTVRIGDREWAAGGDDLPSWVPAPDTEVGNPGVVITFR
jgi:hypothetical protein